MLFPGEAIDTISRSGTICDNGVWRTTVLGYSDDSGQFAMQSKEQIVPKIGSEVFCRVFKITYSMAQAHILSVDNRTLQSSFLGIIRLQDIRKHEVEKLVIDDCFQPGDIVKAKVISLGDSKYFYLSTAETEYGVILAWNKNKRLLPNNWEEMIDPDTQQTYKRKVAKPLILE
jgi:exosome complex component CSL4